MTVDYRSLLNCADGTIAGHVDGPGPGEGVSRWIGRRTLRRSDTGAPAPASRASREPTLSEHGRVVGSVADCDFRCSGVPRA
jgi:hypothetical protein